MGEEMISFTWPWMVLLLPLPWIVMSVSKPGKQNSIATINFPMLDRVQIAFAKQKSITKGKFSWQYILLIMAWIFLVVSLMRPEIVQDSAYIDNQGYDLLLAVDLSRSMDAVDFKLNGRPVSRIAATKEIVGNFVRKREGDRVGLLVFADHAYLTVPLTLDTASVGKMLDNLLVGMAGDNTALGEAIGIGVQVLRKRPAASRVLILLTDGQDTASNISPMVAAKVAKEAHIKIYTIGVGGQIDSKLLAEIADMTNGKFSTVNSVQDLEAVYAEIDRLEKSVSKQKVILIKKPIFHIFTLLSLLCWGIVYVTRASSMRFAHES